MFIVANTLKTIAGFLSLVLNTYMLVILVACIMSWVNSDPYNPIIRAVRTATEPVFSFIRRKIPFAVFNNFDLSPFIAIAVIYLVNGIVVESLYQIAVKMAD